MAKRGGLMTHRDPRQRFDEFYDDRRHGDRPDNSPIFMVLLATGDRHSEQLVHTTCHHVMLKRTLTAERKMILPQAPCVEWPPRC